MHVGMCMYYCECESLGGIGIGAYTGIWSGHSRLLLAESLMQETDNFTSFTSLAASCCLTWHKTGTCQLKKKNTERKRNRLGDRETRERVSKKKPRKT